MKDLIGKDVILRGKVTDRNYDGTYTVTMRMNTYTNQYLCWVKEEFIEVAKPSAEALGEIISKLHAEKAELENRAAFAEERAQELESKLNRVAEAIHILNNAGE